MATTNMQLTRTWVQVAADTDDPVIVQAIARPVEIAVTAADAAPAATLSGHQLGELDAATRHMLGDGFYWARAGGNFGSATVAVSK